MISISFERILAVTLAGIAVASPVHAVSFSNINGISVDFPAGAISFADQLVDFSPGIILDPARGLTIPLSPYLDGDNTLGVPDMNLAQSLLCFSGTPTTQACKFASLGSLGSLTVRFTDNLPSDEGIVAVGHFAQYLDMTKVA